MRRFGMMSSRSARSLGMFHCPSPRSKTSWPSVLRGRHRESPVERAARGNHAQVRVEHEKRLAYGVDDGLGQVMPVRDGGERIAFGHAERTPLYLLCLAWSVANLMCGTAPSCPERETAPGKT